MLKGLANSVIPFGLGGGGRKGNLVDMIKNMKTVKKGINVSPRRDFVNAFKNKNKDVPPMAPPPKSGPPINPPGGLLQPPDQPTGPPRMKGTPKLNTAPSGGFRMKPKDPGFMRPMGGRRGIM